MDGKTKKKGARKQICFQICTPGACGGVGAAKRGAGGLKGPQFWQPVITARMVLMELVLWGERMRDGSGPLRSQWESIVCPEESRCFLLWGVPGGKQERDGEEAEMFSSVFHYIFAP